MLNASCVLGLLLVSAPGGPGTRVVLAPIRYELSFEIDYPAEQLRAATSLVVENRSGQPVREASLLLYRLFRVRSVRDDIDASLPFTQTVVAFEDDGKLQVNQVLVALPKPLPPGGQTTLRIGYDGYLLGYAETGMLYVKDRIDPEFTILREDAYVYPIPGYPSHTSMRQHVIGWSFTYSARVTVPRDLIVANGGRLDGTSSEGDRVTFQYTSVKPSWRMDFAIAKYGNLSSDAARVFYLPGDKEGATGVAQAAEKSLTLFTRWFGPRPGGSALTFIEIPDGWGSQTDVTTIIQTAAAFRDVKQHREVYHKISHLWNVTDTDQPAPRWNEGLATFLEFLVDQEITGEERVDPRATRVLEWLRAQLPGHPQWRKVPLLDYGREDLTDLSYSVGAMFFDLLYRLTGRETFNQIIRDYDTRFATGGTTRDLLDVIRKDAGMDLSRLLSDWITTTGWADRVERGASVHDLETYYRGGVPTRRP